jgi:uncharacterized protein (DUF2147 family)
MGPARTRVGAILARITLGAWLGVAGGASAAPGAEIEGRWLVEKRDAIILVEPRGGEIVGRVVWAKDRDGIRGEERLDFKNPRPELRSRKVLGLETLTGIPLTPGADGWHGRGRIYNPKTGKSYPVKIRLDAPDRLRLRVGSGVLGQSTYWTRAR